MGQLKDLKQRMRMNGHSQPVTGSRSGRMLGTIVFFGMLIGLMLAGAQLLAMWWWPVRRFDLFAGAVGALFLAAGLFAGRRFRARASPRPRPARNGADGAAVSPTPLTEALTAREVEILASLAEGCSNAEIADRHCVSVNTVKTHLRQIYGKLQVGRRVQAVARARELGLVRSH